MKNKIALLLFFIISLQNAFAQRSDNELNRDSILGWNYLTNPLKAQTHKPVKDVTNGFTYSPLQQQWTDMMVTWVQQSYLQRGQVVRILGKNHTGQSYDDGSMALHNYGVGFLGFDVHFLNGKLNLHCCEHSNLMSIYFNGFPGQYAQGFNPGGLYFFAEKEQVNNDENEAKLKVEGIDKKIQPNLYPYRTYLQHYHNNGLPFSKIDIVIAKNGEWPFQPVLVKDILSYIDRQLVAYPDILKNNSYLAETIKKSKERLQPYLNEVAVCNRVACSYAGLLRDEAGHSVMSPEYIVNGQKHDAFKNSYTLVSCTQQVIDKVKSDKPQWLYFNLTPDDGYAYEGSFTDPGIKNRHNYMVYSILHNFNFDYVYKWLADPDKMKSIAYMPLHIPAASSGNTTAIPAILSY